MQYTCQGFVYVLVHEGKKWTLVMVVDDQIFHVTCLLRLLRKPKRHPGRRGHW